MEGSLERLELHLPGLLRLLGESLYSDPRVAYRELVQNAHDACVRRQLGRGRAAAVLPGPQRSQP